MTTPARVGRKRSARTEATKRRITDAAAELLGTRGYEATSLDDVAEAAGVTKGTIYYHFDSKEDLYWAVVYPRVASVVDAARKLAKRRPSPREGLRALLGTAAERARDPSQKYMYYQEMLPLNPEMRATLRNEERDYEHILADLIRQGQEEGAIRRGDPHVMALIALGAIARTARWYNSKGRVPPAEFSETLLQAVLHGLFRADP